MKYEYWSTFVRMELVPTDFALKNAEENFFTEGEPLKERDEIYRKIEKWISEYLDKNDRIGVLAGGGVDSTFLIAMLAKLKFKDVVCVSHISASNEASCRYVDDLCVKAGFIHLKRGHDEEGDRRHFELFKESFGRAPRDIIVPAHNRLAELLVSYGCTSILDGQFADSVLNLNPQNRLLNFFHKIPIFLKFVFILRFLGDFLIELNKIFKFKKIYSFYKRFLYLQARSLAELILILCRIEQNSTTLKLTHELIEKYGVDVAYSKLFNNVLLRFREMDKYKSVEVISPFGYLDYSTGSTISKKDLIFYINKFGESGYEGHTASFTPDN